MKKFISIVLTIMMLCSVIFVPGITVNATELPTLVSSDNKEGDYKFSIYSDNTAEITGYTGTEIDVVIPESINNYPVTSIGSYTFSRLSTMESLTIPEGITKIDSSIVVNCTNLKTVYFNAIDSQYNNANVVFASGDSISKVVIGENVTRIPARFFLGMGIKEVKIPSNVKYIDEYAFEKSDIVKLHIPDTVASVGEGALNYCYSLEEVIIDGGIEKIDSSTFYTSDNIKKITLGNCVKSIEDYAFQNCVNLENITLSESVTEIGKNAFNSCFALTSCKLSEGLVTIGDSAFYYCIKLSDISIPSTVRSIGEKAFYGTAIREITIPEGMTAIENATFVNNKELTDVILPDSLISIGEGAFYGCELLENIQFGAKLETIGRSAFAECKNLKNIELPQTVTFIDEWAFQFCTSLESINIPDGMTEISEQTFWGCKNLVDVTISDSVTHIRGNAFNGCAKLSEINISENVVSIGASAFHNTAWYEAQDDGLVYIGKIAYRYKGTLDAETVFEVPDGTVAIGGKAFMEQKNLVGVILPESIVNIGEFAFSRCSSLSEVKLPSNLSAISTTTFSYCTSLTSMEIPENVTEICSEVFYGCSNLKNITIYDNVKTIDKYAFIGCPSDMTITGVEGSYAQEFANNKSFNFVILGDEPDESTETTETIDVTEPTESTEPTEPTVPTEPTESTEDTVKTEIWLEDSSVKLYPGETVKIKADIENKVGKTTYKSSDKSVAKVNAKGKITARKPGKAKITVTNNGVSKKFKVTVKEVFSLTNVKKGVKITWKKNPDAGKYKIYRSNIKTGKAKLIAKTKKTSYVDKKVKSGSSYYYSVRYGKEILGESRIIYLSTPKLKSVKLDRFDDFRLKWTKVKGAKKYKVYRRDITDGNKEKYLYLGTVRTNECVDWSASGTYEYKIKAISGKFKSADSNAKSITYLLAPWSWLLINDEHSGIDIYYDSAHGAEGVRIYRSSDNGEVKKLIAEIDNDEMIEADKEDVPCKYVYTDTNCEYGVTYNYYLCTYKGDLVSDLQEASFEILFTRADIEMKVGEAETDLVFDENAYQGIYEEGMEFFAEYENLTPEILSVDETGVVTALAPGDGYIKMTVKMLQNGVEEMNQSLLIKFYVSE